MYSLIALVFAVELWALWRSVRHPIWNYDCHCAKCIKVMIGINSFGIVLFLAFGIVWGQYDMKPITPEPIRYMLLFMGLFHAASINMALAVIQLIFEEKATDKESIDHHGAATIRSS